MAHTFKVGDIVRGIGNTYPITNKSMTRGQVVAVDNDGVYVRVIEHARGSGIGKRFHVSQMEEFELVNPASPISRVLYNPPATVVFWSDGTKTVAKCAPHERYDREKGLAIACAKKLLGEGYADAFKEFREPKNRVLSIDEVRALRDGTYVYVENRDEHCHEGVHVKMFEKLIFRDGCFWTIDRESEDEMPMAKWARVWLLPRKPTADELRANPWKREGCK